MICKHRFVIKKEAVQGEDSVKILKCEKCGEEYFEFNGFVHKRKSFTNPESILGGKIE